MLHAYHVDLPLLGDRVEQNVRTIKYQDHDGDAEIPNDRGKGVLSSQIISSTSQVKVHELRNLAISGSSNFGSAYSVHVP